MDNSILLAVDDKPDNLFILEQVLADYCPGIKVITVSSAEKGLKIVSETSIDVAMIDVQMPGMDGIEMTRRLKANKRTSHIPILLITSHQANPQLKAEGLKAGADDFILKPINNIELSARINVMLRIKKAEDMLRKERDELEGTVIARTKQLYESEKRYRTLFNSISDAVFIHDMNGRFLEINEEACKRLGYTREELFKKIPMDIDNSEFSQMVPERIRKLEQEGSLIFETVHVTKKGDRIPTELNSRIIEYRSQKAILSVARDISDRKKAEDQLKTSLKEKEVLLQELYHRTKNNMQVIIGLINLQSRQINDEHVLDIFKETTNRINSMAMVHERLYKSKNLSLIELNNYITELSYVLFTSYNINNSKVALNLNLDPVSVTFDTAMPCGLILNEVISNSLKYAFPDERSGEISVSLHLKEDQEIEIRIKDNGIGLPETMDIRKTDTLGMELIIGLVEHQLSGKVELIRTNGTEFVIRFTDNLYTARI